VCEVTIWSERRGLQQRRRQHNKRASAWCAHDGLGLARRWGRREKTAMSIVEGQKKREQQRQVAASVSSGGRQQAKQSLQMKMSRAKVNCALSRAKDCTPVERKIRRERTGRQGRGRSARRGRRLVDKRADKKVEMQTHTQLPEERGNRNADQRSAPDRMGDGDGDGAQQLSKARPESQKKRQRQQAASSKQQSS
jgi:hypothetical protein